MESVNDIIKGVRCCFVEDAACGGCPYKRYCEEIGNESQLVSDVLEALNHYGYVIEWIADMDKARKKPRAPLWAPVSRDNAPAKLNKRPASACKRTGQVCKEIIS